MWVVCVTAAENAVGTIAILFPRRWNGGMWVVCWSVAWLLLVHGGMASVGFRWRFEP